MEKSSKYINNDYPIYFTYSRNGVQKGWEHVSDCVEDLKKIFKEEKIHYYIDTEDVTVGGYITKFEEEIGKANFIILVFNDKYFHSLHCMYEFTKIKHNYKNKKIYCIKSDDCYISDPDYIDQLDDYWRDVQKKCNKLKDKKRRGLSKIEQEAENNGFYLKEIEGLYTFFSDLNYGKVEDLKKDNYANFIKTIKKDLSTAPYFIKQNTDIIEDKEKQEPLLANVSYNNTGNNYHATQQTSISKRNTVIRSREDLDEMQVPFIGEIPLHTKKQRFFEKIGNAFRNFFSGSLSDFGIKRPIVVKVGSKSVSSEAFRILRTNIEITLSEREPKPEGGAVILVTSMMPGRGKTYITTNLAASFAIKDRKTIVVDLDLRRRTFSLHVGEGNVDHPGQYIQQERGVSTYLASYDDDWHDLVKCLVIPNARHKHKKYKEHENEPTETVTSRQMRNNLGEPYFDVLPAGEVPPNPTELLTTNHFKTLIAELKCEYDVIILDSPPYDVVADTRIIARETESTLLIVRADLDDKSILSKIDKLYIQEKLPAMSLLLNGTKVTKYGPGYHYYNYNYGYVYDYESDDEYEIAY